MVLNINKKDYDINADPEMPLLWALRDIIGLTGTKFGCGEGVCGSCTVLSDGVAIRSCATTVSEVIGKKIITIEGLSDDLTHPVQLAWMQVGVAQCGYCQPGQILSAVALLNVNPKPTEQEIDEAMEGNICRCGTYNRIKEAIHLASKG